MFEKASSLKLLVIGDLILDHYIYGEANRISPEAPVPIINKSHETYLPGGAANVALNLKQFGVDLTLIGSVGNDIDAERLTNLLDKDRVNHLLLNTEKPTTVKTRVIARNQQILRIDSESTKYLTSSEFITIKSFINEQLDKVSYDGIVISDYNKGLLSSDLIQVIITRAKEDNIPVFVDPKNSNYWEYKDVTIFKPNKKELYDALDDKNVSLDNALEKTINQLNCDHLVCTLSQDGIVIKNKEHSIYKKGLNVEVADVSGAGDSAFAMIIVSFLLGYNWNTILELANLSGAQACQKVGVSLIVPSSIEKSMSNS